MTELNSNQRLSWRFSELAASSGISERLLRKHAKEGILPTRKIGTATIIMHDDALTYLKGEWQSGQSQK